MEIETDLAQIHVRAFLALTLGVVVYFLGAALTRRLSLLRAYSIPEPVSGGLLAALIALGVFLVDGREVVYDLAARDVLLVYFFTTIGMNASFGDLRRGGPLLAVMLALTVGFMFVQAAIGMVSALLFGLPSQAGVLLGTASLVGGHGTAIAWGPTIAERFGVPGAAELGIAMATVGLIVASLLGGPIAKFLIEGRRLPVPDGRAAEAEAAAVAAEVTAEKGHASGITTTRFMQAVLWIHVAIIVGVAVHESLEAAGVKLPLFVPCLLSAILLTNTMPRLVGKADWPSGGASLTLISEFSLSVFLSMSLMSMQLWTLGGSVALLAVNTLLQAAAAAAFILLVVFPATGRNYFAAVISAGFTGVTLGATPTAIANMTAVTQRYGPSPLAFIVLPLVSAFFVDLANAFIIQLFLSF